MKKFEIGAKYESEKTVLSNFTHKFICVKRTNKTITLKSEDGELLRRKIKNDGCKEFAVIENEIYPIVIEA